MSASYSDNIIVGIDLGTTNSVIAVLEGDQPRVVLNSEGSTRTPSIVSFGENGEVVVGEIARRQSAVNPSRTVTSVKRLMGRSLRDVVLSEERLPFEVTEHDSQLVVRVGNAGYTPAQISAFILKKLKQSAEDFLGESVSKAIITVPAYFDDLQRHATREAGALAGLDVLRLVNEPTSAAMAYGLGRTGTERVAVYDFGGGTFDLTILDISDNTFEVLTSTGDTHLGGDDIDELLVDRLITHFCTTNNIQFEPDPMALRRLKDAAEKAKCELSVAKQTLVHLPFLVQLEGKPLHLEMTVSRRDLEDLISPLVKRTIKFCQDGLDDCELRADNIDKVILVGGSTRIPLVQEMVEDFFGIVPFKGVNPDEIVALGAATQGGVLAGKLKEVLLLDITPHSLGVEVANNAVSTIIEKNSTIPLKSARLFTTTEDEQEMVLVHVLQGESEKANENRSLGKFTLTGLQPGKAGTPRVQVTFSINADGMVEVSAEDMTTRKQATAALAINPDETGPLSARDRSKSKQRRKKTSRSMGQSGSEVIIGQNPAGTSGQQRTIHLRKEGEQLKGLSDTQNRALKPLELPPSNATASSDSQSDERVEYHDDETIPGADLSDSARSALESASDEATGPSYRELYQRHYAEIYIYARQHPGDFHVLDNALRIFLILDKQEEARALLVACAESGKSDKVKLLHLFDIYLHEYPTDEAAIGAQAEILSNLGRMDEAISQLEEFCLDDAGSDTQIERLINLYRKKLSDGEDNEIQFKMVKILIRANKVDEAITLLQRLIQSENYRDRSLKILGLCFWQKGLHYLAWQRFQQLPLTDEIKDILYRLSGDMEDTDQLLNAKIVLQHLADGDPDYRDIKSRVTRVENMIKLATKSREDSATPSIVASLKDSRFAILEEINRGSMGIVYRAKDKVLEEIVALKILNDYMTGDPNAVERFKREARAAKRLSHHNIVRIHDMFEYSNKKILSMEYIEGMDVKKLLQDRGALPAPEVVAICRAVCDALAYAHKTGIVHRDIKPANIMITSKNEVKVTDFGIAKFLLATHESTQSGSQIIGTPLYMSPEQIQGDKVDARSDIYSLGATLYEMVSGKPPFSEGNIEYHHLHSPPPPLPDNVPRPLAAAIMRCLAKAPADRYQTTEDLNTAMQNA